MELIAPDVHRLALTPRDGINVYLVGDVLVDAGIKQSAKKILQGIESLGIELAAHVVTHAHPDHVGATTAIVDATGVPVSVGALDKPQAERGETPVTPTMDKPLLRNIGGFLGGYDGFTVDHTLAEGDDIGCGFTVLDTPGHSAGHVTFYRESDGIIICGDVVNTMSLVTTRHGLQPPPDLLTPDPARNRQSIRRLADLEPQIILAGHGPPVLGAAPALRTLVAGLKRD